MEIIMWFQTANHKLQKPFYISKTIQVLNFLHVRKVILQQNDQIKILHLYTWSQLRHRPLSIWFNTVPCKGAQFVITNHWSEQGETEWQSHRYSKNVQITLLNTTATNVLSMMENEAPRQLWKVLSESGRSSVRCLEGRRGGYTG